MKFVIDRKTWFRGRGAEHSKLLRKDGRMCCIGQIAKLCQVPEDKILDISDLSPLRFHGGMSSFPSWFRIADTDMESTDLSECYGINDDEDCDDDFREASLKKIFARHGDELEFVN